MNNPNVLKPNTKSKTNKNSNLVNRLTQKYYSKKAKIQTLRNRNNETLTQILTSNIADPFLAFSKFTPNPNILRLESSKHTLFGKKITAKRNADQRRQKAKEAKEANGLRMLSRRSQSQNRSQRQQRQQQQRIQSVPFTCRLVVAHPTLFRKGAFSGLEYITSSGSLDDIVVATTSTASELKDITYETSRSLYTPGFCHGLGSRYLQKALQDCDMFLTLTTTSDSLIQGIMIANVEKSGILTISVLCGSSKYVGVGRLLMNITLHIARHLGLTQLDLESVPNSVHFYKKMKFEYRTKKPEPTEEELYPMVRRTRKAHGKR